MVLYFDVVRARLQVLLDAAPQLVEIVRAGNAHPHDEMLVFHVLPLVLAPVNLFTVRRLSNVLEVHGHVRAPRDITLVDRYLLVGGAIDATLVHLVCVVEQAACDETARYRRSFLVERLTLISYWV